MNKNRLNYSECFTMLLQDLSNSSSYELDEIQELYDILHDEITKLSNPFPGMVNWELVANVCITVLQKSVKDYNVANYLVVASIQLHGPVALYSGVDFLNQFITVYWQVMRPPLVKKKLRENSITWFFKSLVYGLQKGEYSTCEKYTVEETLSKLQDYCDNFSELVNERYTVPDTVVSELNLKFMTERQKTEKVSGKEKELGNADLRTHLYQDNAPELPKEKHNNCDKSDERTENRQVLTQQIENQNGIKIHDKADEKTLLSQCSQQLAELANTKTNVDAKNPSGYYYRRISAWMTMQTPPMSNEMGISELKSPSKFDKRRLLAAQNSGTHLSVVMESEALIERFPLWLDANIISFRSLSTMESSYSTASTAILSLLSDLLRRFPDLRHTRFSDGEPMFGLECQSMQAYLIQDKEEFSVGELQPSTSGSGEIVKSEVESTTKTHKNTSSTQVDLRLHDNHRLRCQLLMDQIENCIANNNYDLALAQFSYLWDQLSEINFFTWDPGMAAKLSERHISTILAKHGDKSELNEKEIAQCRKLFQYLSVTNISKASKITVSKFI